MNVQNDRVCSSTAAASANRLLHMHTPSHYVMVPLTVSTLESCIDVFFSGKIWYNEKALGETQTLRAGRSNAEPKKIRPAADPLSGGAGRPKFNQLEMVTTFTYRPSLVKFDACKQFRAIVVTDPHRPRARCKPTDRTDNNTLRR